VTAAIGLRHCDLNDRS